MTKTSNAKTILIFEFVGIYSPITVEGSIITNNILSSCFSQVESHAAQVCNF
jgi:hypothetical protein